MKLNTLSSADLAELEAAVVAKRAAGSSHKALMLEFELNHSQVELILIRADLTEADYKAFEGGGTDLKSRVVAARKANTSWGVIGVLAGEPESKVRKLWAESTGLKSQGLRIGRGGRFYYGDEVLYTDTLRAPGTEIPVGANHSQAVAASRIQRMYRLDFDQLKELGAAYGVEHKKGQTKVAFAKRVEAAVLKEGSLSSDEAAELVS